jgi:hypothetical protein
MKLKSAIDLDFSFAERYLKRACEIMSAIKNKFKTTRIKCTFQKAGIQDDLPDCADRQERFSTAIEFLLLILG